MPQSSPQVKMYTCGVTVYDDCHIGHARSLYVFEVIRRYLKYRGFEVRFVRNITDIDDKIINRASQLNIDWRKLVEKYIDSYDKDLEMLGIDKADVEPRATDNIEEMIKYIEGLINKGYAYVTDSGVYFSVRKFKNYGQLSRQSVDDMRGGGRIDADEAKQDPLDFALWKKAKEGEPSWESPWGGGRPGWHIECSVMSQKYLETDTLDIHGGGRDLIFPHHENEITQGEALTGKPFSRYWIHHGLLTINGQKMAKSLGNFVTIKEVLNKYPADVLKLFYLQAHYSSSIDFSWEGMEQTKRAYERIDILIDKLDKMWDIKELNKEKDESVNSIEQFKQQFIQCMDDDFNTPRALAVLFDMVGVCNKIIESNAPDKDTKLQYARKVIREILSVFCLTFVRERVTDLDSEEIERKIKLRLKYKEQNNFQEADQIRKELVDKGIILEDTKDGTTWRVKK